MKNNKIMIPINKDKHGNKISIGSQVLKIWAWGRYQGRGFPIYRVHVIEMDQEEHFGRHLLGSSHNRWKGKEVEVISQKKFKTLNVPLDEEFFFDDNGKAVIYTDQHLMDLNDEKWEEYLKMMLKQQKEIALDLILGKQQKPE